MCSLNSNLRFDPFPTPLSLWLALVASPFLLEMSASAQSTRITGIALRGENQVEVDYNARPNTSSTLLQGFSLTNISTAVARSVTAAAGSANFIVSVPPEAPQVFFRLLETRQTGNPVLSENTKRGTSAWQLVNPATNHEIEGYASLTSVNRGGQISLFVSTTDPLYTIEVYRMGWYGGAGARLVAGPFTRAGVSQTDPLPDVLNGNLVQCDWTDPYTLAITGNPDDPTDWCSGIYLAKLTGSLTGKQSYIIFVVRDDDRPSDYLFQSSFSTFEAYNIWGGYSLYQYNSAQAPKVSFDRPFGYSSTAAFRYPGAQFGVGAGEFLSNTQPDTQFNPGLSSAGWEYNMVRFLEREGYDVTYCTDVDTHENGDRLLSHRAFLEVGHPEYLVMANA